MNSAHPCWCRLTTSWWLAAWNSVLPFSTSCQVYPVWLIWMIDKDNLHNYQNHQLQIAHHTGLIWSSQKKTKRFLLRQLSAHDSNQGSLLCSTFLFKNASTGQVIYNLQKPAFSPAAPTLASLHIFQSFHMAETHVACLQKDLLSYCVCIFKLPESVGMCCWRKEDLVLYISLVVFWLVCLFYCLTAFKSSGLD